MNKTPLVSVVMPNFNGMPHVTTSVQSIINQTYPHWELIICDDGSTDTSYEALTDFAKQNPQVHVYKNEKNLGNPQTRNRLFSLVSSDAKYIAVLDSDDLAEPTRLETQVRFLENNSDISLVGTAVTIINENGEAQGLRTYPETHREILKKIMVFDPFAQPSVLMRKSSLMLVGLYDEELARCQDYDLFIRFVKAGFTTANLKEPLTKFRIHSNQGKYQNIRKAFMHSFKVRSRYLFSKQFFTLPGFFMWGIYLGGTISSFILPAQVYAFLFNTLFVKRHYE